jgi:hypothetical protein
MRDIRDHVPGFIPPGHFARLRRRRSAVLAEFVTTLALFIAIMITLTMVGLEIAQAGALKTLHPAGARIALSALMGLILAGAGSVTALVAFAPVRRKR